MIVADMLDLLQEAVGEAVGSFYNISTRLAYLNRAQNEMVRETGALTSTATLTYDPFDGIPVPEDFLDFGDQQSTVTVGASKFPLMSITPGDVQNIFPTRYVSVRGTPEKIWLDGGVFRLYPEPTSLPQVELRYVAKPAPLEADTDLPFNGVPRYQDFAWGIIQHAASNILRPRAPELSDSYEREYKMSLSDFRKAVQTTGQDGGTFIRPGGYK